MDLMVCSGMIAQSDDYKPAVAGIVEKWADYDNAGI
jgi:hypothetical protein